MTVAQARSRIRPRGLRRAEGPTPGHATGSSGLPAGTEVFSADNHISLAEDIFYEQFPASDEGPGAPRRERRRRLDGRPSAARRSCHGSSSQVLTQYDPLAGVAHRRRRRPAGRARVRRHPPGAGLPQRAARVFGWPDKEVRELCFRIYNQHIAEVQERSGRPHSTASG